jgi:hypothetical protein
VALRVRRRAPAEPGAARRGDRGGRALSAGQGGTRPAGGSVPAAGGAPGARSAGGSASLALGLRLALLALVLDPPILWYERLPIQLLAGLGLLVPAALRSPALWVALCACATAYLAAHWPFPDNHDHLAALFCLAAACALASSRPARTLAHHARWMLGLTFLFASLWKLVLSPDFADGRFFRMTLLSDPRFENLAVLAGGITYDEWARNDAALDALLSGESAAEETALREPPRLRRLARALTLYTGAVEAALAAAFLWPAGRGLSRARNALLLLFVATIFSFATVRGFGWLLASLGAAQCEPGARRARAAYLAAFALVALYASVPWSRALVDWLGKG